MARRAAERGRATIDSAFLTEIRNESMLLVSRCLRGFGFAELSTGAFDVARAKMRRLPRKLHVLDEIRAFLAQRTEKNEMVLAKFRRYLETLPAHGLPWTEEARARIQRMPEPLRERARRAIEVAAREGRERLVSGAVVDRFLGGLGGAPGALQAGARAHGPLTGVTLLWTAGAEERVRRIPLPPVRAMVIRRAEAWALAHGLEVVDEEAYEASRRGV